MGCLPQQRGTPEPLNMGDHLDPLEGKLDGIVQLLKDMSAKVGEGSGFGV